MAFNSTFIKFDNKNKTYINRFEDHLNVMFAQSPEWDTKNEYNLKNIRVIASFFAQVSILCII